MDAVSPAFSFVLVVLAGWMNRRQQQVIEYLKAENRMLKAKVRGRRIRFTDVERALLARQAKAVGRKALLALETSRLARHAFALAPSADRSEVDLCAPAAPPNGSSWANARNRGAGGQNGDGESILGL